MNRLRHHLSGQLHLWTMLRGRSRVLVLVAVFCLFGSVGLMGMQMGAGRASVGDVVLRVVLAGGFAILYFVILIARRFWYFVPAVVLQSLVIWLVVKTPRAAENLTGPALQRQLIVLATCAIVGIIVAYSLAIHLFSVEGRRYFQIQTEIALASEIHSLLVPECKATVGGFEIYGASVPSGEVGGDLVDVVEQPGGWIGYVADVSGHGVSSGVLMAMFKTALRAQMANGKSLRGVLNEVHRTLFSLKPQNMFVTVGILQGGDSGRVAFASAGHPPILQYHKRTGNVSEHAALDPPLGIVENQQFSEASIQCEDGDVLLVLTDGLTEVFDARGNEIGFEPIKACFMQYADASLQDLFPRLRSAANSLGPQIDDQTLLLAKYRR